jgi:DNA polymerase elongation subunit (family B)
MQWVGLQLIMSRAGSSTATGDAIDERKGNSRLAMWADNLKDALEIALDWMTQLGGFEADTTVNVNKDFSTLAHMTMADVRDMFVQRAITGQTYIREAQRRGVIAEDIDPTEEYEQALMGEVTDLTAQP